MRYFILAVSLIIAGASFSQSKKEQIAMLQHQLDSVKAISAESAVKFDKLKKENEVLRKIMKGYVYQIDTLVTIVNNLRSENDQLKRENETPSEKAEKKTEQVRLHSTNSRSKSNQSTNEPGNPFGDPFSMGDGQGNGGAGKGFGVDSGQRIGFSKDRTRLNNVHVTDIQIDEEASIYYKLTVDQHGNVVAFSYIKYKTTTTNTTLINRLGEEIKKQVKYNKSSNTSLEYQYYTIHVKPS